MAPAPRLPSGGNDWRYKNKTGGQVQGSSTRRPGQPPQSVADQVKQKAKDRADRNQKKPPPKDNPAGPRKSILNPEKPGMDSGSYGGGGRGNPYVPPKVPKPKQNSGPVKGLTTRVPGKPLILKSQPGPGAPTGGTGRDTPGAGKERGQFEQDRQRERGTGKDRPPIYKPKDDGQRGGYINRSKPIPPVPGGKPIPKKKPGINTGGPVRGLTTLVP